MIELSNGTSFRFVAAAGSLGVDGYDRGNGPVRLWKAPFRWLGWHIPELFAVVTKTFTLDPLPGHYRWWKPWRTFRPLGKGSFVNALGLPNKGLHWWMNCYAPEPRRPYSGRLVAPAPRPRVPKLILSLAAFTPGEAWAMADLVWNRARQAVAAIEYNASCVNVEHKDDVSWIVELAQTFIKHSGKPVFVKLGAQQPYLEVCQALAGSGVAGFDLINTAPYSFVFPDQKSPLARYELEGGVSGPALAPFSRLALHRYMQLGLKEPVISGGGVDSYEEAVARFRGGAGAVSFGSLFLSAPARPTTIALRLLRENHGNASHPYRANGRDDKSNLPPLGRGGP